MASTDKRPLYKRGMQRDLLSENFGNQGTTVRPVKSFSGGTEDAKWDVPSERIRKAKSNGGQVRSDSKSSSKPKLDYKNYDKELKGYTIPEQTVIGSLKNVKAKGKLKPSIHTIKKGETLGTIAKKYEVDWRALAEANNIDNPNLIYAGNKLKIDPATMSKKSKRKVAVNRPNRTAPPGFHTDEIPIKVPTMKEATATNLPTNTDPLNIDIWQYILKKRTEES